MPSINRYIMTIARCSNQFRSERLRDTGLCGQHCAYILRVCREPGTTQDAIAREIYVNKSNVTRQLAVLPEVRAVLREWNECITADFTEEEKEQFKDLLARAAERAQQRLDEMKKE